ncbi:carbohydrate kinase family protein [Pelagibacterium xiamenense]|uniref:carbohydrate kinase family protein n=1 Tax=Pelagibacterium xiamenense TaxID=2901140 RepID=UPI001E539C2D|nr:PfkB family carbohydrate kinase [Pelagibacterium xiamenense]MCD7059819.1 PfkB family carbohydrate kinase [Pelagibacterium xiamenense]
MTRKAGRILVVGDVMTDIVVLPEGPIARGTDRRATIRRMQGGSGANQALWLAAEGADVTLAARVGSGDAEMLSAHFASQGITPKLATDVIRPTGTLICIVDPDGERSFLTDRGANAALGAEDLPLSLLDDVGFLHVSAYALVEPGPRAAVLALMAAARQMDIPIGLDPASTGFLEEIGSAEFRVWTSGAQLFFPNADEAGLLTGKAEPDDQIADLLNDYETVILKAGERGAILARRDGSKIVQPARAVTAVDSTGAGDAFVAGFLAGKMRGAADADALRAAVDAGARAVSQIGAQPESGS